MTSFFESVNSRRHELLVDSVSQTFLQANTARMLRGIKARAVRKLLRDSIGDCHALTGGDTQQSFDERWGHYVEILQKRQVPFGQAAKVVNLYVKATIAQRGLLTSRDAKRISRWAHFPIDSLNLKRLWRDCPGEMNTFRIRRNIQLKRIKRDQYDGIQELLRRNARTSRCVPLDYDFAYLDGER